MLVSTTLVLGVTFCGWSRPAPEDVAGGCVQADSQAALSFQGSVLSAQDGSPIPNAQLRITTLFTTSTSISGRSVSANSDANGEYGIPCLAAGMYALEASARGFVAERITFAVNRAFGRLPSVRLSPESVIQGFVLDESGEGVPNALVKGWIKVVKRGSTSFDLAGIARSSSSGAFRMHSLRSGDYILQAVPNPRGTSSGGQAYTLGDFYPRGALSAAHVISIPTATFADANITISHQMLRVIQGRALDVAGAPIGHVSVRLTPCFQGSCIDSMSIPASVDRTGNFKFRAITIGAYRLQLIERQGNSDNIISSDSIDVDSSDLSEQVLTVLPPTSLSGRIAFEEGKVNNLQMASLSVSLRPANSNLGTLTSNVAVDGSFTFQAVPLGSYVVEAAIPGGSYVKTISLDNQVSASNEINVTGGASRLEIDLVTNGGAILATLDKHDQRMYPAAERPPQRVLGLLYRLRNGTPDPSALSLMPCIEGVISFSDLRPGSYLLFVVGSYDVDLWEYGDFVKSIASRGTELEVRSRSRSVVSVDPISDADIHQLQMQLGLVSHSNDDWSTLPRSP